MPASLTRAAALAAAFVPLSLAEPASAYTVKSLVQCTDVIREDTDDAYREMNKWWLMGYFTGRNFSVDGEAGKAIEDEEIYEMALDYCRSNPNGDWDDAAIYVYERLD